MREECVGYDNLRGECYGITKYETRIPAANLGVDIFELGYQFGATVLANENDLDDAANGQKGWSGFGPYAVVFGKNVEDLGLVTLTGRRINPASTSGNGTAAEDLKAQLSGAALLAWRNQFPQAGCNYEFFPELLTWEDAETACTDRGSHLVSIHSDADWIRIQDIVPNGQAVHIGANDRAKEMGCDGANRGGNGANGLSQPTSGWEWTDGSPWDWTFWAAGQPARISGAGSASCDGDGTDCVALQGDVACDDMATTEQLATPACGWKDHNCSSRKPYVCGYKCGEDVIKLAPKGELDSSPRLQQLRVRLSRQKLQLRHLLASSAAPVFGGGGTDLAGSITCKDNSKLTLQYVDFMQHEQAGAGAGVIFTEGSVADISFCKFLANKVHGVGAGVLFSSRSNVSISNTEISANAALGSSDEFASVAATDFADSSLRRLLQSTTGASTASAIVAEESTLMVVRSTLSGNTGGALLVAASSTVSIARTSFKRNVGGDVIIAAEHSNLEVTGTAFVDNSVVATAGPNPVPRAPVSILSGSKAVVSDTSFTGNTGATAGAIHVTASTASLHTVQFLSNRAYGITGSAGAMLLQDGASVDALACAFVSNEASALEAAGAALVTQSAVSISDSTLSANIGHGTNGGSGAVLSKISGVSLSNCSIEDNAALGGAGDFRPTHADAVWVFNPTAIRLTKTTFHPILDGSATVSINPGSLRGVLQGGCVHNPCEMGQKCMYANFSVSCHECPDEMFSQDGLDCSMCPAGKGPAADSKDCEICVGNNVSTFGICIPCLVGLVASEDHAVCEGCDVHQPDGNCNRLLGHRHCLRVREYFLQFLGKAQCVFSRRLQCCGAQPGADGPPEFN